MHGYKWPINCTRTRNVGCEGEDHQAQDADQKVPSRLNRAVHRNHHDAAGGVSPALPTAGVVAAGLSSLDLSCACRNEGELAPSPPALVQLFRAAGGGGGSSGAPYYMAILQSLSLSGGSGGYRLAVTDEVASTILSCCMALTSLDLSELPLLSAHAMATAFDPDATMHEAVTTTDFDLNGDGVGSSVGEGRLLETLNLSGNRGLGGETLAAVLRSCPRLTALDFGHCFNGYDDEEETATATASDDEMAMRATAPVQPARVQISRRVVGDAELRLLSSCYATAATAACIDSSSGGYGCCRQSPMRVPFLLNN